MLEFKKPYPIEVLGKAQGNVDVFVWSEGEYDSYIVQFVLLDDHHHINGVDTWFREFNPNGRTPIAFFHIKGDVKIPAPIEVVSRLAIE